MEWTLHFKLEKETKGAVRYKEVTAEGIDSTDFAVGTLYVRKDAFSGTQYPKQLLVKVTEG